MTTGVEISSFFYTPEFLSGTSIPSPSTGPRELSYRIVVLSRRLQLLKHTSRRGQVSHHTKRNDTESEETLPLSLPYQLPSEPHIGDTIRRNWVSIKKCTESRIVKNIGVPVCVSDCGPFHKESTLTTYKGKSRFGTTGKFTTHEDMGKVLGRRRREGWFMSEFFLRRKILVDINNYR